jgi:hypothetical protein
MSEAAARIQRLERQVMWRTRLLSLQDSLALALMMSGLIAAGVVVIARLRPIAIPVWVVIIGLMTLSFAVVLIRWFSARVGEGDAAFLIDESLNLDDRIATSRLIIERGGPTSAIEEALIEDASTRVENRRASAIVPFRTRPWYPLLLVSAIGLAIALMIPSRLLPVDKTLAAERADISAAGEHLEQTAKEIEQSLPAGTATTTLAKEQAEIGRNFRRASSTRSEALRRLNALEERIRGRHKDLSETRADEIVSLADRRMRSALSTLSTARHAQTDSDESMVARQSDTVADTSKNGVNKETRLGIPGGKRLEPRARNPKQSNTARSNVPTAKAELSNTDVAKADDTKQIDPRKPLQEPVSGRGNRNAESAKDAAGHPAASPDKAVDQALRDTSPADSKNEGERARDHNTAEQKADQQSTEAPASSLGALKALPGSLAQQAAKALPKLSEELLRKAAELRANELKPADIERLRKAAEFLAGDLEKIGQSKELQRALQEMARQIKPEQIEQVARELGNQEQLKQELEAAARLLSENQQAKEMVAGLAGQFARTPEKRGNEDNRGRGVRPIEALAVIPRNPRSRIESSRVRDENLA